ncbi:uncharacterized protein LOC142335019 [Convolutriloba macropyga]|uniref:uncharacterized protein LOC142335019 n=1 Tax=Convolutriloba macropyga TaxID=536237 RepID=UPI003F52821C
MVCGIFFGMHGLEAILLAQFIFINAWVLSSDVPECKSEAHTCNTDSDCNKEGSDEQLRCMTVGPPDDPGPRNCLCRAGYYGDPQEKCWEFSYKAPIFGMYKGCYPVDKNGRTVKQAAGDYRPYLLNTYSCRETCSNQLTAFAALQEGDICFCANDIYGLGEAIPEVEDGEKCNSECTDEDPDGSTCGGFHNEEDGVVTQSFSSVYTTQRGSTSAWFVNINKDLLAMTAARAQLDFAAPYGFCKPLMYYRFDFGNGAGFTYPHPHNWIDWTYSVPGTYIITGMADGRYPPVDATKVTVREEVRKEGVVVRCEEFYRFGMKSNCSVSSILGTGLKANIYWGDRDRKQFTFSAIEDPFHCAAGNPVMQTINCASYRVETHYYYSAGSNKILIDPAAQFDCEGILKGFEYFVKGTSSTSSTDKIKFKMLAPDCGSGHFCYETMECVENSTQCVPPFSKDCGGEGEENAYCHEGEGCTAGGCSSQDRSTVFTNVDYKVVPGAEWTIKLDDPKCRSGCGCHGVFELDLGKWNDTNHFRVYPGYILAFDPEMPKCTTL